MIEFMKSKIIDIILCLCMSLGMIFPIFSGFVLDDLVSGSLIITALISLLVLLICSLFSYNKKTVIGGLIIAFIFIIAISTYFAKNAILVKEVDHSLTVSLFVIVIISFLIYLINAYQKSLIALFLIGNIVIGAAYFLKFPVRVPAILTFDFSVIVALWYHTYQSSLQFAQAGQVQLYRYVCQSVIIMVVIIGLSSLIYYGVIKTIDPPTRELKLIEKLENMDVMKQLGIFSQYDQFDSSLLSSQIAQDHVDGDQKGDHKNQETGQKDDTQDTENKDKQTNGMSKEMVKKIKYNLQTFVIPWSVVIITLLVILYLCLRYFFKKKWEKSVEGLSYENQVINYYHFFIKRLDRTKFKRIKTDTLMEYSYKMDYELSRFDSHIKFSTLTDIYMSVYYGQENIDQKQLQLFKEYYQCFYKGLRKEIGLFKYYFNRLILRI